MALHLSSLIDWLLAAAIVLFIVLLVVRGLIPQFLGLLTTWREMRENRRY